MSWALEMAVREYEAELKAVGLEVNMAAGVLLTPSVAVKLPVHAKTDEYRRTFRDAIKRAKEAKKAKLQAKQTKLL